MIAPKYTITIMPSYGNAPYAWLKPATDESRYVGPCIADAVSGFNDQFSISAALKERFAAWAIYFENFADRPNFDWAAFNLQGLILAKQLRSELGPEYRVIYYKAAEDPERMTNSHTEIAND
jgi:hypothetical protein